MTSLFSEVPNAKGFLVPNSPGRLDLIINAGTVFFNATQLSHVCNNMRLWTPSKQDLMWALSNYYSVLEVRLEPLCDANTYAIVAGMYQHPALVLDLVMWHSAELFVQMAVVITDVSHADEHLQRKLSELFSCGEIRLVTDKRGWIDAEHFCSQLNPKSTSTNLKEREEVAPLVKYLGERDLLGNTHYCHPLLLLRLAACVNMDVYLKCCKVIFCSTSEPLRWLFHCQILVAGGVPPPPEPPVSSGQETVAGSSWRAGKRPEATNLVFIYDYHPANDDHTVSENDYNSDRLMDIITEADSIMTKTEHDIAMNRESRKFKEILDQERAEKQVALGREYVKDKTLLQMQEEKRQQEEAYKKLEEAYKRLEEAYKNQEQAYNTLLENFENLQIKEAKYELRETLRKRSHRTTGANAAADVADGGLRNDASVTKHECLVLFTTKENTISCYRRQLHDIVKVIYENLPAITEFVGWFLTNSAAVDYNKLKTLVKVQMEKACGSSARFSNNEMELVCEGNAKVDLQNAICSTLRSELQVVEADVRILGRLFDKKTRCDDYVAASDPEVVAFVTRVHTWIEEKHAKFTRAPT